MRLCCGGARPFKMNVTYPEGDKPFMELDHPMTLCRPAPMKCCCYYTGTMTAGGEKLGEFTEKFYWCVPTWELQDAAGAPQYNIHMPTCCGGLCVDVCAEGCCNFKIPFYVYAVDKDEPGAHVGKIVKVWGGMARELFSEADTFVCEFPEGASDETKANLLGATFMLNAVYFEGGQDQGAA